jgi:hypothetical protein
MVAENHQRPSRLVPNVRATRAESAGDLEMLLPDPPRARSRIFPRATSAVVRPETADLRPAILVDESMLSIPEFQAQFSDCRIIVRKLRAASIEINDRCAVLLGEFEADIVANAIVTYETVVLINASDQFHCYPSVKIRNFPTHKCAFKYIRGLVGPAPHLRDQESLHEMLLSLFPAVSRSLAQNMLRLGNPIAEPDFAFGEFPEMNVYMFTVLLDAETMAYQRNVARGQKQKRPQGTKVATKSRSILSFIPGIGKVPAP